MAWKSKAYQYQPLLCNVDADPQTLVGPSWFGQGLFCQAASGSLGPDYDDLVGQFTDLDRAGFNGWDGNIGMIPPSSMSPLNTLAAPAAMVTQDMPPTADHHDDDNNHVNRPEADDDDDSDNSHEQDVIQELSLQLTAISQRATRARRLLHRTGCPPPTVSSPEVNEAFEDTNSLLRIVNNIKNTCAHPCDEASPNSIAPDYGLVFSALASHQHLLTVFKAICHLIQRCLESMTSAYQHRRQQQQKLHDGDIGPSSVAQFVMVLQLLTHLINRMDRNLVQVNAADGHGQETSLDGQATPITPSIGYQDIFQSTLFHRRVKNNTTGDAQSQCGLPAIGQVVLGAIPDEHKRLRLFIQELQTRIDHSELQ
ncbi:fungal zn(2)-Cys(6) binuclear cluster domain-containing protein [Fusarium mexicanum]|uniref:Fungal zn(2)-Cys(6) binuclear cluster domain-containing protein n=1 Tax=Fusarium mexicanum TaxID=751941 RepID=A0A8H5I6N2_9HYPO|nr:fungal zn(2)-Cys(6) binuclear cluster domain-containing protein [Fusarium mexicanum]